MKRRFATLVAVASLQGAFPSANAQSGSWRVNAGADAGPLAQVDLPWVEGRRRVALIAFEYARRCDPIFSFGEFSGRKPGSPITQSRLGGSKIGVIVNGDFYTWHAGQTIYDNGYEAGFGVPNDLVEQLLGRVNTLVYVTPSGERVPLPTANFIEAFREAVEVCRRKVK